MSAPLPTPTLSVRSQALFSAANCGDEEAVRALVVHERVHAGPRDSNGWTPLMRAVAGCHKGVVNLLLTAPEPASTKPQNVHGKTALHYACANDQFAIAQVLLLFGGDPRQRDAVGRTPFDDALEHGHSDLVADLLAKLPGVALPLRPDAPYLLRADATTLTVAWETPAAPDLSAAPRGRAPAVLAPCAGATVGAGTAGDDPLAPSHFRLQFCLAAQARGGARGKVPWTLVAADVTKTHFRVTGLTPHSSYVTRVAASNGYGWGEYSEASDVMTTAAAAANASAPLASSNSSASASASASAPAPASAASASASASAFAASACTAVPFRDDDAEGGRGGGGGEGEDDEAKSGGEAAARTLTLSRPPSFTNGGAGVVGGGGGGGGGSSPSIMFWGKALPPAHGHAHAHAGHSAPSPSPSPSPIASPRGRQARGVPPQQEEGDDDEGGGGAGGGAGGGGGGAGCGAQSPPRKGSVTGASSRAPAVNAGAAERRASSSSSSSSSASASAAGAAAAGPAAASGAESPLHGHGRHAAARAGVPRAAVVAAAGSGGEGEAEVRALLRGVQGALEEEQARRRAVEAQLARMQASPAALRGLSVDELEALEAGLAESLRGVRAVRERKMRDALGDEMSRTLCSVCLARPKTSLFLPCKHLCACSDCAARIMRPPPDAKGVRREPQCPICRIVPSQVLDVYA